MRYKVRTFLIAVLMGVSLLPVTGLAQASENVKVSDAQVEAAYQDGRQSGVISNSNMTEADFKQLCDKSVIPEYEAAKQSDANLKFADYIKEDNYEVPEQTTEDNPTIISAGDHSAAAALYKTNTTSASKGYSMKAGDILVCYGTNSDFSGKFIGHAAIATSAKYVLQMTGPGHRAEHYAKKTFFNKYTGRSSYVAVYRVESHPTYTSKAASYAYNHMYKATNPSYFISTNLYHKSPSYCSKYVYLAYYWGATKNALTYYSSNLHIVTPHGLVGNFKGSFHPAYIHKITKY